MQLRFKVDQGEALRQGVDAPTSVVTIEINPKALTQEERNLLADRMDGIDVFRLYRNPFSNIGGPKTKRSVTHIIADAARFEALMAAVKIDEAQVQAEPENTIIVGSNGKIMSGSEHLQRIVDTGVAEKLKVIFGWPSDADQKNSLKQSKRAEDAPIFEGFPLVKPKMARQILAMEHS
jgi:hypothetical protein